MRDGTASSPGASIPIACAKYFFGLARHVASYTQKYFAHATKIKAPGDEAGDGIKGTDTEHTEVQPLSNYAYPVA